jgi:hypothetical protein
MQAIPDDTSYHPDFEARTAAGAAPISEGVAEASLPLARGPEETAELDRDAGDRHTDEREGSG